MPLFTSSNLSNDDRDPGDQALRDDLQIFILAAAGVIVFLVVFFYCAHSYDLATGTFFAFALGLLARGKLVQYLAVFAMANLNRETTFLLILVFAVYFFFRLPWQKYAALIVAQLVLFLGARIWIMTMFASHPGDSVFIQPIENLQRFLEYPLASTVHWLLFALVLWLCARRWRSAPRFLQVALLVMLPVQLILYLVIGWAFEIRVFAEVFPVVWVALWRI